MGNKEIFEDDIFSEDEYKLLIAIAKRGFEQDILEAAKSVGTNGAILLQGKGVSRIQKKFLGFTINPENTIVLILVRSELVVPTMKAVYNVIDFKSEAKGMVFAVPVSLVAGMNEVFDKIDVD